jgi:diaminohydroxyphosphoribosylaminopyrimidine deaminase/5-amino-6-(5-phosphoribosylamino)uracil reductase
MVGAVVVREGVIVGEGFHPRAGMPHAEVFALRAAGELAKDADLYVTLEPCSHQGRTPPCADAVIKAGIRRVTAAMVDPNPLVAGKGLDRLRNAGVEVQVGLMESEARALNEGYIKRITTGLPFVLWKAAMSLDGKIATRTGNSRWVTGEVARKKVHRLRSRFDAVLVGVGTVLADDPQLTVRGIRGAVNPIRVVADSRASMPPNARVLDSSAETIVAVTSAAPKEKIEALREAGARVIVVADIAGRVDLRALMLELGSLGMNSVLLESGGELTASALAQGIVDRGMIFIAPKIVGGRDAKTPVEGMGIESMEEALCVSTLKIGRAGVDVIMEFEVGGELKVPILKDFNP